MILIIGRTASGKDTLANMLVDEGFSLLRSFTTRKPRSEDDDSHLFVTQEEYERTPPLSIVAETVIDDNVYFATKQQVGMNDIYVIDPEGADELIENMPDMPFTIVYVRASDELRRSRFCERQKNANEAEADEMFDSRDASENERFDDFEKRVDCEKPLDEFPDNANIVIVVENDFDSDELKSNAKDIAIVERRSRAIYGLLRDAVDLGTIRQGNASHTVVLSPDMSDSESPEEQSTFKLVAKASCDPTTFIALVNSIVSSPEWAEAKSRYTGSYSI